MKKYSLLINIIVITMAGQIAIESYSIDKNTFARNEVIINSILWAISTILSPYLILEKYKKTNSNLFLTELKIIVTSLIIGIIFLNISGMFFAKFELAQFAYSFFGIPFAVIFAIIAKPIKSLILFLIVYAVLFLTKDKTQKFILKTDE